MERLPDRSWVAAAHARRGCIGLQSSGHPCTRFPAGPSSLCCKTGGWTGPWPVSCPSTVCSFLSRNRSPGSCPSSGPEPVSSWPGTSQCPPSAPKLAASTPDSECACPSSLRSAPTPYRRRLRLRLS